VAAHGRPHGFDVVMPMPEQVVAGRTFTVRDNFPAKQFHALQKQVRADEFLGDKPFDEQVLPYVGAITAWEFSGDPQKREAWEALDAFEELPLAIRAVNQVIVLKLQKLAEDAKNWGGPPT